MSRNQKPNMRGKQGKKDSRSKRVNFDNERVSKFDKDEDGTRDPKVMKRTSSCNDVSWYANNPELLKAAASIPFSSLVGQPLPNFPTLSVPGVMQIIWEPFVGGLNNAVNQAANQIYSDTVHANSRNQSYDPADEMLIILAGAQVFSAIALGMRAYGIMRRYDQQDRYTPDALLMAMGFNPSDLKANFSKMWFDLNQLIVQSRQIWIPNVMPLIERWFWMNSNIFKDGASVKSQYYVLTPGTFLKYEETTVSSGGSLGHKQWASNGVTRSWQYYVDMVTDMLQALINSQDRGIIFGDILKAYGADKLYTINEMPSDYQIDAVYDREVLSQIENLTVCNYATSRLGNVYQDPNNGQLFHCMFDSLVKESAGAMTVPASQINCGPRTQVLNFHQLETPTPEQIMVATRLASSGIAVAGVATSTASSDRTLYVMPATAGTEVPIQVNIIYNQAAQTGGVVTPTLEPVQLTFSDVNPWQMVGQKFFTYYAFDWCPGLAVERFENWVIPANSPNGYAFYPELDYKCMDYDNFTFYDASTLDKMNTTAVYGLFGVPSRI